jgi:hypothetical protein
LDRHATRSIPVTGKGVAIDYIRDDKMAESRILMETLRPVQQLDVFPEPAAC